MLMSQTGSRYAQSLVLMMPDCRELSTVTKVEDLLPRISKQLTVCLAYKQYEWTDLEDISRALCVLNSPLLTDLDAFIATMLQPTHCSTILEAYAHLKISTTICRACLSNLL